ncbi:MAG: ligase-associated DNA damage response endonuclease PdeM [Pseudomonadota bacterium]
MSDVLEIVIAGETLLLLPDRAMFWPARRTLLIADWHIGKAAVFGRRGLAIPEGDLQYDLQRLDRVLASYATDELIVLGDLMHAPPLASDRWPQDLADWLGEHATLGFSVVAGNHDRVSAERLPAPLTERVDWYPADRRVGPFCLAHEPEPVTSGYVLAGHLHPTLRLSSGADRVRSPVFWFRQDHAVLPAFGSFTGGHNIRPKRGDRVFMTGPDSVVEITPK